MKWEKTSVESIVKEGKGNLVSGPFGSNISSKFFRAEGIPVIRGNNIPFNSYKFYDDGFVFISQEKANELKNCIAVTNDIIFTAAGTIGQVGIIPDNTKYPYYIISNKQIRLRCDEEKINPLFAYYWFSSSALKEQIQSFNSGSSIPLLTLGSVKKFPIILPPLPTQRRIASILSAYDDLIENNLKRIKLLEEKAFLRYKSDFDFFKPSNDLNKIPFGWEIKRADEIFKINIGKTPPREQSEWFNDGDSMVKWVSIKDINNSTVFAFNTSETVTEMAVNKFNMNVAKANTVILSFKLTVGKVAITTEDMTTNEAIAHFNIEDDKKMCPEYIYFYLKAFPYDSLGSTSSIGTAINSKVVKAMPILLPPQKVISDYRKDVENDFRLIFNLLRQNSKLREARDILLPRLMCGEIEV